MIPARAVALGVLVVVLLAARPASAAEPWIGVRGAHLVEEAVRSNGARTPVMLGGTEWARDDDGWLAHLPPDPADAEVASDHTYNFSACFGSCRAALAKIAATHPVVTGEMGEGDCRDTYIDPYTDWADAHGTSYLAWAWDTDGGWTCRAGPSLITAYDGTPTAFGRGFREHLKRLAATAG